MQAFLEIPLDDLSPEAVDGIIQEFIGREGTDYGHQDWTYDQKASQVLKQLKSRHAIILFNRKDQTINIVSRDEYSKIHTTR